VEAGEQNKVRSESVTESEVILFATPSLQVAREGLIIANSALAGAEVDVRSDGSPRALFCSRGDSRNAGFVGLPRDHDFWFVTLEFVTTRKDGKSLGAGEERDYISVFVDDVTGVVVDFRSL
jgi:hypothetical protein